MASFIKNDSELTKALVSGLGDQTIRKRFPYMTPDLLREARNRMENQIVELPSGTVMINELNSLVGEAREFLDQCKSVNDIKGGLNAIKTIAKVADTFFKGYDTALKAQERKESVTQNEFNIVIKVLQDVLVEYPAIAQEFSERLAAQGLKDTAEGFEPDWDMTEEIYEEVDL